MKWPNGPECPACLAKELANTGSRLSAAGSAGIAASSISVKLNTIFEDSAIKLDKWLTAMWMLANCKNGVSSYEIHRSIGVTQKSAWFMLHRIREAMKNKSVLKLGIERRTCRDG